MRSVTILNVLAVGLLILDAGCRSSGEPREVTREGPKQRTAETAPTKKVVTETPVPRSAMTAESNPTTNAGRGEPSLDASSRPAAWIYVDGHAGKFVERDGTPQVQWFTDGTVSAAPTFRVEVFEPLLGTPTDFVCTLDTRESSDNTKIAYGIKADTGTFRAGRDYALLTPGENFTVRNRLTGDVVSHIGALAPGTYVLVVGIKNPDMGKEGLAIAEFKVGEAGGG